MSVQSRKWFMVLLSAVLGAQMGACTWGHPSEKPPLHLWLDMDDQPRYEPFEKNTFFEDEAAMRSPVSGAVARGEGLNEVQASDKNPLPLSREVLARGQNRYNVYCTPCHGLVGNGKGIVALRGASLGYVQPSSFHTELMRQKKDGHYYQVIRNGIRNMGPYGSRINVEDRWAIVHYIRTLQLSQSAPANALPLAERERLENN